MKGTAKHIAALAVFTSASTRDVRFVTLSGEVARLEVPLIVDIGVGENWDQAH